MANHPDEVFVLTDAQLTEVCVQFATVMGWTDAPGTADWYGQIRKRGGPRSFNRSMTKARRKAVERAAAIYAADASPSFPGGGDI